MINDNTILSSFNDRPTLLEWLKKVEEALKTDTATAFHVNNRGNATLTFSIDFANGTSLESESIVLQKGESVIGAEIRNGHLILTLSNGDELDAGDVKPVNSFLINESQHLIVNFDDGTNQDLGAIFSGNVNIDGTITANVIDGLEVTGNSIIEKMNGYSFNALTKTNAEIVTTYAGVVKNGNKVTFVCTGTFQRSGEIVGWNCPLGRFVFPKEIGLKLYEVTQGGVSALSFGRLSLFKSYGTIIDVPCLVIKDSNTAFTPTIYQLNQTEDNTPYLFRFEITFLLSDNLAV